MREGVVCPHVSPLEVDDWRECHCGQKRGLVILKTLHHIQEEAVMLFQPGSDGCCPVTVVSPPPGERGGGGPL